MTIDLFDANNSTCCLELVGYLENKGRGASSVLVRAIANCNGGTVLDRFGHGNTVISDYNFLDCPSVK